MSNQAATGKRDGYLFDQFDSAIEVFDHAGFTKLSDGFGFAPLNPPMTV